MMLWLTSTSQVLLSLTKVKSMSAFIEGFLVAFLAGTVAGITVGWVNRKILKFKKMRRSGRVRANNRPASPSNNNSNNTNASHISYDPPNESRAPIDTD